MGARQAYDNGQEVINVEFNKSDHEAPGTLLREYIKEELTIAVIPIDLILSVDEAKLVDTEGSQLVHQMNAISYIGDHFAKNMISYVVKEPEVGMTEPIRRCYVFQVDDDIDLDIAGQTQVKEIFGTFLQCFQSYQRVGRRTQNSIDVPKSNQRASSADRSVSKMSVSAIPIKSDSRATLASSSSSGGGRPPNRSSRHHSG